MIYSRPIIPILISMIFGIMIGLWFPDHRILSYFAIFISISSISYIIALKIPAKDVFQTKKSQTKKILFIGICFLPFILFFAIGYLSIQQWAAPKFPTNHIVNFLDGKSWKITGIIDKQPIKIKNRLKLILKAETLENNATNISVMGNLRVTVFGNTPLLSIGDRICFTGKIKSIDNFNNPGGFDYKRYMAFKKIWGRSYLSAKKLTVLDTVHRNRMCWVIENASNHIRLLIKTSGEQEEQNILKALVLGDKTKISPSVREAFNRVGVSHLLAISGLHIGIVAGIAFLLFKRMLSNFQFLLWNAWTKKTAAILSFFPVLFYGLLSGMSPSTQRAVIMVTVFLATFLFERERDSLNTVAIAALIILIVHPPSLFSISFQLSFLSVIAIIYGISKTHRKTTVIQEQGWCFKAWKKLFAMFLVSLFAYLGALPIVMFYFNQVSLIGVLANLIIIPLIGFIAVPLGLFAVFLYPFSVGIALLCVNISSIALALSLKIILFLSNLSFVAIKTITPSHFEICCFYMLAWAVLNIYSTKSIKQQCAVILIILIIFVGDVFYWIHNRFLHDDLKVTIIDVKQGSSALLELPGGSIFLIDGGGFSDNSYFDVGENVIAPFLWRKKIRTVDTIILSHPNSDHLNGLLYIAKHFHVKRIWTNGESCDTASYNKFLEIIKQNKIYTPEFQNISHTHNINNVQIDILYPLKDFKIKQDKWRNINNNSLVVRAKIGSHSFLFPGDIMGEAERELVSIAGNKLQSTTLIAPHHGSKTSSTTQFLKAVKPKFLIISAGLNNSFNHPNPLILKRYEKFGYKVFRTDKHGALTMSTDGKSLNIIPTIAYANRGTEGNF